MLFLLLALKNVLLRNVDLPCPSSDNFWTTYPGTMTFYVLFLASLSWREMVQERNILVKIKPENYAQNHIRTCYSWCYYMKTECSIKRKVNKPVI